LATWNAPSNGLKLRGAEHACPRRSHPVCENARDRGRRLVSEGRLILRRVDETEILAVCRGDSGELHELGYRQDAGWWCSCMARTQCGHLYALQLVTIAPGGSVILGADLMVGATS
jgi:hypothetical protein